MKRLRTEAEALCRAVAPELNGGPLYVVLASDVYAEPGSGDGPDGCTMRHLDLMLRPTLERLGRWSGRGPAMVLDPRAIARTAERRIRPARIARPGTGGDAPPVSAAAVATLTPQPEPRGTQRHGRFRWRDGMRSGARGSFLAGFLPDARGNSREPRQSFLRLSERLAGANGAALGAPGAPAGASVPLGAPATPGGQPLRPGGRPGGGGSTHTTRQEV